MHLKEIDLRPKVKGSTFESTRARSRISLSEVEGIPSFAGRIRSTSFEEWVSDANALNEDEYTRGLRSLERVSVLRNTECPLSGCSDWLAIASLSPVSRGRASLGSDTWSRSLSC